MLAALICALLCARSASAAPGNLDTQFATSGVYTGTFPATFPGGREQRVAIDDQQRPLLAATVDTAQSERHFHLAVARLTTGGVLDTTFNPNGTTPGLLEIGFGDVSCADDTANGPILAALAVTPDHHIVLAVPGIISRLVALYGKRTGSSSG